MTIVFYFHLGSVLGILCKYIICGVVQCVRHKLIFVVMCAVNIWLHVTGEVVSYSLSIAALFVVTLLVLGRQDTIFTLCIVFFLVE